MSLPMSKLVCGIGDAPVTGAWMPMTISSSRDPGRVVVTGLVRPLADRRRRGWCSFGGGRTCGGGAGDRRAPLAGGRGRAAGRGGRQRWWYHRGCAAIALAAGAGDAGLLTAGRGDDAQGEEDGHDTAHQRTSSWSVVVRSR